MSETQMPVAEASETLLENERNSYELAFHVLPTVAEGEVSSVFDSVKALITHNHGEISDEEAPERFELAYEIIKHLEGKNRKFTSAYFGWVRFSAPSNAVAPILEEMESRTDILRHMLIKLTRVEEENPFRFHAALESKKVTTVDEADLVEDAREEKAASAKEDEAEPAEDKTQEEEGEEKKEV